MPPAEHSACVPRSARRAAPCGGNAGAGCSRRDWLQYAGLGDWWMQHIAFETLVAAMLDDPFSYIGSLGFDILVRLLSGSIDWRPEGLPRGPSADVRPGATSLNLSFATRSVHWKASLPHALRERIESAHGGLSPEEAVCAAALLSDAISEDKGEQARWMKEIAIKIARGAVPDGESPFTIHSTVYAQLARGWPKYSGNLTAIFSSAAEDLSSGTDRFACSESKSVVGEASERNIDAGEFKTSGYKSPTEVEAVMVSPPSAHPGMGRRLRQHSHHISVLADRSEAAFRAAFPTFTTRFEQIEDFEWTWAPNVDTMPYPMPLNPPPLEHAFFRVRESLPSQSAGQSRKSIGSMVAVLAPLLLHDKVASIQMISTSAGQPQFLASNAPIGPDVCTECGIRRRCFAPKTPPSTTVVPVVGYLFRCSNFTFHLATALEAKQKPSTAWLQSVLGRVRAHSTTDHTRMCRAWQMLGSTDVNHNHDNAGWPTELMGRLRQLRLRSATAKLSNTDAVCSLTRQTVAHHRSDSALFSAMCSSPPSPPPEPPSPPSIRTRTPSVSSCHGSRLSACRCDALFRNRSSLLTRMWSMTGWKLVVPGHATDGPCWGSGDGRSFFERVITGGGCQRNWYSSHPANHVPTFKTDAPSVLGFDDDIKDYCVALNRQQQQQQQQQRQQQHQQDQPRYGYIPPIRSRRLLASASPPSNASNTSFESRRRLGSGAQECAKASRNILELDDGEYNSCANLEWQVCAAMGRVRGQQSPSIVFANAPGEVDLRGDKDGRLALGACTGNAPYGCGKVGYANDDIFFLEACIYSKVCANREEFFRLEAGKLFTCQVSAEGIRELQALLVAGNQPS